MNGVIAVGVTFNCMRMLQSGLERLSAQSVPCGILLVDNVSTDGTEQFAQQKVI